MPQLIRSYDEIMADRKRVRFSSGFSGEMFGDFGDLMKIRGTALILRRLDDQLNRI